MILGGYLFIYLIIETWSHTLAPDDLELTRHVVQVGLQLAPITDPWLYKIFKIVSHQEKGVLENI